MSSFVAMLFGWAVRIGLPPRLFLVMATTKNAAFCRPSIEGIGPNFQESVQTTIRTSMGGHTNQNSNNGKDGVEGW